MLLRPCHGVLLKTMRSDLSTLQLTILKSLSLPGEMRRHVLCTETFNSKNSALMVYLCYRGLGTIWFANLVSLLEHAIMNWYLLNRYIFVVFSEINFIRIFHSGSSSEICWFWRLNFFNHPLCFDPVQDLPVGGFPTSVCLVLCGTIAQFQIHSVRSEQGRETEYGGTHQYMN